MGGVLLFPKRIGYFWRMSNWLNTIVESIQQQGDPAKVEGMKAYMKQRFDYFGLTADVRKQIEKIIFPELKILSRKEKWILVRELWAQPQRELHYFAVDWINSWPKKEMEEGDDIHLLFLLSTHSWWDSVDSIASNYLGWYWQTYPEKRDTMIAEWRAGDNFWLQRSCLIFQLKYKKDVDFELLKGLIREFKPNKEFFIQKAIGWSLRQHSRIDPWGVQAFVEEEKITGLARREAMRLIEK